MIFYMQQKNMLANSLSPYLRAHAHQLIWWQEWSEDVFRQAIAENKPVFVSIGYSTCHWCHVMAHESFDDPRIATILNEHFLCIKVDRETRPDIDAWLMEFVQQSTGRGGWPLSVFLTPDKKPFFGGTYFPKESIYGLPAFGDLLGFIKTAFLRELSIEQFSTQQLPQANTKVDTSLLVKDLYSEFDSDAGGFGRSMKFPPWCSMLFLLRYFHRTKDTSAKSMVKKTLDSMAKFGLYDHVGGGFHRYCVDNSWTVPHFEKMLYDQAMGIWVYSEAFAQSVDPKEKELYKRIVEETIGYLQRDCLLAQGYASALDADSENGEGEYYIWSEKDIRSLPKSAQDEFRNTFHLPSGGNFEGQWVLNRKNILSTNLQKQLLFYRKKRMQLPARDDKILMGWNSLLGHALCIAARYVHANSQKIAEDLFKKLQKLRTKSGLLRYHFQKVAPQKGFLEDYAWYGLFSLSLYELTGKKVYLKEAEAIAQQLYTKFWKENLRDISKEHEEVPLGSAGYMDHPIGSSSSATCYFLLRLSQLSYQNEIKIWSLLQQLSPLIMRSPEHFAFSALIWEESKHGMIKSPVLPKEYFPTLVHAKSSQNTLCWHGRCEKLTSKTEILKILGKYYP